MKFLTVTCLCVLPSSEEMKCDHAPSQPGMEGGGVDSLRGFKSPLSF